MNDQPDEETRTEANENESSLERETRTPNTIDAFSASNGDGAGDNPADGEVAEDVEIEVVLLANDEEESADLPRVLTDNGSSAFRWYMLAPGVLAAGGAAALLLKYRSPQQQNGASRTGQQGSGVATSALQALSGAGGGLGSVAGNQKARAQALAAQAMAMRSKTQARKQKSGWEQVQDSARTVVSENLVTIIALAASAGLTIAGRLIDGKREGNLPLQPLPPKKPWYRIGPWS